MTPPIYTKMVMDADRRENVRRVIRVSSGNFLEMYDFMVYGYYATYIAHAFFPAESEFASLMLTFGTFGLVFTSDSP